MTKEEKQHLGWLRERKAAFEQELADLQQLLIDEPDYPHRKFVEDDIAHDRKIVAMIRKVAADRNCRRSKRREDARGGGWLRWPTNLWPRVGSLGDLNVLRRAQPKTNAAIRSHIAEGLL